MTGSQIFAFLVMPLLLILSCSMVFCSYGRKKPENPVDPPKSATTPASYTHKPRKKPKSAKQTDAAQNCCTGE
jgi:hypothetical protein